MSEREKRDYVIVGAGAIGGTLAFHLVRAGHRVLAVDTDAAHVLAIRRDGITITRGGVRESVAVPIATPDEAMVTAAMRVLLCVKGLGATEDASSWVLPRLAANGFVASLQNGLQLHKVAERVGAHRTVGAFVDFFADLVAPGVIADGGAGTLMVGEVDGAPSERVSQLVTDLQAWGPARATANIAGYVWAKLGFSAMLAATALADARMADLIDRYREVMMSLTDEVFALADHRHIALERFDAFDPAALRGNPGQRRTGIDSLVMWLHTQPKTRSGVWRDIAIHHRPTEAVGRYAELIEAANEAGCATPYLDALVDMLRDVESGRRGMSEDNLDDLRQRASARPLHHNA